jgi:hypothetical protein
MTEFKRSHTVYIQSKYRDTGRSTNYTIALPDIITNDANLEKFKICLQDFSVYNQWYLVSPERGNKITVNGFPYTIATGTYTFAGLIEAIQSYLDFQDCEVIYYPETNKVRFSFQSSATMTMDDIGKILGFTPLEEYTGMVIQSRTPLVPCPQTHIYMHLINISPLNDHLTLSNHTGEVRPADILAKILINASPFQLVTYQQVLERDGLYTNDNSLDKLEVMITDADGNELKNFPEHDYTIKIESMPIEDVDLVDIKKSLEEIKTTLGDIFLQKHIHSMHRGGYQL